MFYGTIGIGSAGEERIADSCDPLCLVVAPGLFEERFHVSFYIFSGARVLLFRGGQLRTYPFYLLALNIFSVHFLMDNGVHWTAC